MTTNTTPNCYECRHRRDLVGDRHSQCVHPRALHGADALALSAARFCGMQVQEHVPGPALRVTAHAHGIAKGWFMWPFNFDPVWLVNCDGFEAKTAGLYLPWRRVTDPRHLPAARRPNGGAIVTGHEEQLRDAMMQFDAADCFRSDPGFVYRSAFDFVLKHGSWHAPCPMPRGVRYGQPKACYGNAILLSVVRGWTYVEGFALPAISIALPVMHAWNLDDEGRLVDSTWRNLGLAYIGVAFSVERADDCTWNGDGSVLSDWHRGYPLFREPWTGEKPWTGPASPRLDLMRARRWAELYTLMMEEHETQGGGA